MSNSNSYNKQQQLTAISQQPTATKATVNKEQQLTATAHNSNS
jgi:hypothetical protein